MTQKITPVIMAGGTGTRLWPLSRSAMPKQFWSLVGDRTMLQQVLDRTRDAQSYTAPIILTHDDYRFLVAEQCREVGVTPAAIALETRRRNTAIVAVLAALLAYKTDPDAIIFLCPADHVISDLPRFQAAVAQAKRAAQLGYIVTFGILPEYPETGYGYIDVGSPLKEAVGVHVVARFVEKPNLETAKSYVDAGHYTWNSGMFMARARTIIDEYETHAPALLQAARDIMAGAATDLDFVRFAPEDMDKAESTSIDYALMEKTSKSAVVPASFAWSDIGSWQALWEESPKDKDGNAVKGPVTMHDCKNVLCHAASRQIALMGLSDVVVIDTDDALLITPTATSQNVKLVVDKVGKVAPQLLASTGVEQKIWGQIETLSAQPDCRVRKITLLPDKQISYQSHQHRTEHWTILDGSAEVTLNGIKTTLGQNESIAIPVGTKHAITPVGADPVTFIEIQTGAYMNDEDVERFSDNNQSCEKQRLHAV